MLVLSAVYHESIRPNSDFHDDLMDKDEYKEKLERTIRFLRNLSTLSPTLKHDTGFLESIARKLFPDEVFADEVEPRSVNVSFSA